MRCPHVIAAACSSMQALEFARESFIWVRAGQHPWSGPEHLPQAPEAVSYRAESYGHESCPSACMQCRVWARTCW